MASRSTALAFVVSCTLGCAAQAAEGSLATPPVSAAADVSAYRTYAKSQAVMLVRMMRVFATDIRDGNVEAAQNDYATTRRYLERIRPLLAPQPDLARRMDASADAYPDKERDPAFSGFHRLEYGLFVQRSTQDLVAYADRLYADALKLEGNVATQPIPSDMLRDAPAAMVETVSTPAATGGRETYSQTDLWDIEANVDGAKAIVAVLRPQIESSDPLAMARLSAAFEATSERLSQLRDGCGFKAFDTLTHVEKAELGKTTAALGHELHLLKAVPAID